MVKYLCFNGCGEKKLSEMIYKKESNTLECPCGCDSWYITRDKIPIQCRLCEHNDNNEYCTINDKEEEFLEELCDGFEFDKHALVELLKEVIP